MNEIPWTNYGEVNYLDEGGVLIKDYYDEDRHKSLYEAVLIVPFPDDGSKVYAGHMVLDVADYKDDPTVIDFIQDYKDDGIDVVEDKEIAATIVEALGLVELGMIAFNEYGGQAHYAMSYDAYAVDKADLVPQLSDLGIHIDPQRLEELNEEIAYQKYKEEWIKEHISDTEMVATQAAYENDEESKFMSFEEYVEEYGFANGMIYASFDEFLDNEYKRFDMSDTIDVIRKMGANEHITLNNFMEGIDVVITKDAEYHHYEHTRFKDMDGTDVMNLVTVDFQLNGKSIASTYDIHVDNLEETLNDILEGKGNHLVDETRSLQEIYQNLKESPEKTKKKEITDD